MHTQAQVVRPNLFQTRWQSLRGLAQVFWSRLTDDDLLRIDGRPRDLVETLQQRYQRPRQEVVGEVGRFLSGHVDLDFTVPDGSAGHRRRSGAVSHAAPLQEDPDAPLALVYPRRTRRMLKLWWSRLTEGEIDAFLSGSVGLVKVLQAKYFRSAWDIEQEVQWFFDQLLGRRWLPLQC